MDHREDRTCAARTSAGYGTLGAMLLALGVLSACSSGTTSEGVSDEASRAMETVGKDSAPLSLPASEFFALTRDMRRCASPLCGGYWVRALNRILTRCADGSAARQCYVAEADFRAAGGEPVIDGTGIVVRGAIESNVYPDFGNLGRFVAVGAFSPVSSNAATGAYFRVVDNGIRCITEPCFSVATELLNTGVAFNVSDFDLSQAGASAEELEAASAAVAAGGLIVAGTLSLRSGQAGLGIQLRASQFFLPTAARCYSSAACEPGESCNAGEVCLPPPGCGPGRACPAVCTGYCVAAAPACATDADCSAGNWCRVTESGSFACAPFAAEGASCNGFTVPWMYEQCAPGLACDLPEGVADAAGICRAPCASARDCQAGAYCANDGLCHADGSCDVAIDCLASGNDYVQILCVGYPVCPTFGEPQQGQCSIRCGNPQCIDVTGDFGPCDQVLGWGRVQGACVSISGCDPGQFELFTSQAECEAACSQ